MGCIASVPAEGKPASSSVKKSREHRNGRSSHTSHPSKKTKMKKRSSATLSTLASKSLASSGSSGLRRLPDRGHESSSSGQSNGTDEYVERLVSRPEEDEELAKEISRRQSSAVRAKVNQYDQMDVKAKVPPPLMEVRKAGLSSQSDIFNRVQSFEVIERDSKVELGPPLEELRRRRDMQDPNRFTKSGLVAGPVYSL